MPAPFIKLKKIESFCNNCNNDVSKGKFYTEVEIQMLLKTVGNMEAYTARDICSG